MWHVLHFCIVVLHPPCWCKLDSTRLLMHFMQACSADTGCQEVLYEEGPDGKPIVTGLRMRRAGEDSMVHGDCYVAALDCQGAKKLVPAEWRKFPLFDNIHKLEGVPVITVQLRCALIPTIGPLGCICCHIHLTAVEHCISWATNDAASTSCWTPAAYVCGTEY